MVQNKTVVSLVECTLNLLVENPALSQNLHLRKFSLDCSLVEFDFVRDVTELNSCIRFNHFIEVFLEQTVVQASDVRIQHLIRFNLGMILQYISKSDD
jgi:hypothetical protein